MKWGLERVPLPLEDSPYAAVKDPCPVFDGQQWHLFGTGIISAHEFELLHATAPHLEGPWRIRPPVVVDELNGGCVAAPGVVADEDGHLHMFLQTDYNRLDGRIEHMVSHDQGQSFHHATTALTSDPGTDEAGIYDPHPAELAGRRYLVYSAFSTVGEPNVHLAVSGTGSWGGPWQRLGAIIRHEDVQCHNQRGHEDYEWGLEGAQLIELPGGGVLLNAVCFTPAAPRGSRQRVFFATAPEPAGPYVVHGPVLAPPGADATGENGHATVVMDGERLTLFFQERDSADGHWRYALARARDIVEVAGIEPASFGTEPGLLRAQPAARFSAPAVTQASR